MSNLQCKSPLDAIVFDCDGTLSSIEGIDVIAELNGVGDAVKLLTQSAMNQIGLNTALYSKRLALAKPTLTQMLQLGELYIQKRTEDVEKSLALLTELNKTIYVISAGLLPAVQILTRYLKIPDSHVFAVPLYFDAKGCYQDFDRSSSLSENTGKRIIIEQLKLKHPHIALIGDGANDLACQDIVDRFVGFGGNYLHTRVAEQAQFYIRDRSILKAVLLCLTEKECGFALGC